MGKQGQRAINYDVTNKRVALACPKSVEGKLTGKTFKVGGGGGENDRGSVPTRLEWWKMAAVTTTPTDQKISTSPPPPL